jgi:hypothetical protein
MSAAAGLAHTEAYFLNDAPVTSRDRIVTGREVLTRGGLKPPSDYRLILAAAGRSQLVELDAEIELRDYVDPRFYALQSDRVFSFTVDEIDQVWGNETIPVDLLVRLVATPPDRELVLERVGEPDIVLSSGGTMSLAGKAVEHLRTRPKTTHEFVEVTVFTTSGTFPEEGALRVPPVTVVKQVLARAAANLGLTDTTDWVVTVGGRDINPDRSFTQNGLTGRVELEWGPREGGGGA